MVSLAPLVTTDSLNIKPAMNVYIKLPLRTVYALRKNPAVLKQQRQEIKQRYKTVKKINSNN